MDKGRLTSRRKDFKKNFEDPRRRREDAAVQIRKQARAEQVSLKRATLSNQTGPPSITIPEAVEYARSGDPAEQLLATSQFRKILAVDKDPPIQQVIDTGIVPLLTDFLRDNSRPELQLEAAWTLTNIASGTMDQTRIVTANGAIPIFVDLLTTGTDEVRDQAVWALGNIAGDCPHARDLVLGAGALEPLLAQIRDHKKLVMLRNASWALSNLCRGSPGPRFLSVAPALPVLRDLVHHNDPDVLIDAAWAVSYLLDTSDGDQMDKVLSFGVCTRMVDLLTNPSQSVQNPALRSVGQVIAGTHQQTEIAIQSGVLGPLSILLSDTKPAVKKEACWILSNVAAGTVPQIQQMINANILEPLIELMTNGEIDIKRECVWAVSNAVIGGSDAQIDHIVRKGCVRPLCDLLDLRDKGIVQIALEAIDCILGVGQNAKDMHNLPENPYIQLIEEADGCAKLEALQLTPLSEEVYKATYRIMTTYFQTEEYDGGDFDGQDDVSDPQVGAVPAGGFDFRKV